MSTATRAGQRSLEDVLVEATEATAPTATQAAPTTASPISALRAWNSFRSVRLFGHARLDGEPVMVAREFHFAMYADEECLRFAMPAENYACEWVRLAGLTDNEDIRNQLLEMAR